MTQRAQPSGSFLFPHVVSHVAPRPSPPSSPAFLGSGARAGTTGQTDQSRPVNALKVSEGRPGRAGAEGRGWRRLRPATGRAGEAGWPMQGAPSRASVSPSVYRPGSVQDSVSWAAAGWAPLPLPAAPPRPRPSGRFRASLPVRSPLPWRPCRCGDGAAPVGWACRKEPPARAPPELPRVRRPSQRPAAGPAVQGSGRKVRGAGPRRVWQRRPGRDRSLEDKLCPAPCPLG